jgi:type IV pilus assembly protein PilA
MNKQQGFTLIELMIVVAIIGILAAVAIPAYQDYTVRAKVTEGLSLASGAKTSVAEYYSSEGELPTSNGVAGMAQPQSINGNSVSRVEVLGTGTIQITFSGPAGSALDGALLDLVPTTDPDGGPLTWNCGGGATDLAAKYRPSSCR